ncbi:hypothetical protein HLB35_15900 [Halomonas sp. TBZ9]|uniref:Uncharacterized protein n=1 Tax=Vreelandella azerica TaxID=2732867 RepID=A0A7Y3XBZ9_9GAMM|nr:hypothetical protein [Halomonas azerica]NOG32878.1 hypothetical protein [Halomonas azerica]
MSMTVDQSVTLESRYGSFGGQIHGAFDEDLSEPEREHCHRILQLGLKAFHDELAAAHGGNYPMGALVAKIDTFTDPNTPNEEIKL